VQLVSGNLTQTPGHTDLVAVNRLDGNGLGPARYSDPNSVSFAPAVHLPVREDPAGSDPRSLALIDLDEDGDLDIAVVARNDQDTVVARVLRNDLSSGQLAFAPASDLDAGSDPVAVVAADLNGDAQQDLVAINGSFAKDGSRSGNVVIRLNNPGTITILPVT